MITNRWRNLSRLKSVSCNLVWVRVPLGSNSFIFCSVYLPPETSTFSDEDTWEILENDMDRFSEQFPSDYFIFLGDFNGYTGEDEGAREEEVGLELGKTNGVYMIEPSVRRRTSKDGHRRKNNWGKKLLDFCGKQNLVILNGRTGKDKGVGDFTCFSGRSPSVIDYGVVSLGLLSCCVDFEVMALAGSDHVPIRVELGGGGWAESRKKKFGAKGKMGNELDWREGLRFDNDSEEKLKKVLVEDRGLDSFIQKSEDMAREGDIAGSVDFLSGVLYKIGTKVACRRKNGRSTGLMSFFDKDCEEKKKEVLVAFRLLKASSTVDLENNLQVFRDKRRGYKRLLKLKKRRSEEEESQKIREKFSVNDTTEFWKLIRKSTENRKLTDSVPHADTWPEYLEQKYKEIYTEEDEERADEEMNSLEETADFELDSEDAKLLEPVGQEEIWHALKSMRGNSAPGIDGVPTKLLKWSRAWILPVLALIFSAILSTPLWPKNWQISIMIPLFKKGERNLHKNYRGISLGSSISKLFCRVLSNRMDKWLHYKGILIECQAGFRENYSTIDQIFCLQALASKYTRHRKNRLYTAFLDIRGAFDEVSRSLLKVVLVKLGLPIRLVEVIMKMYEVVKVVVKVGISYSRPVLSNVGLKQGCTLSPRLFSLFINDIEQYFRNRNVPMLKLMSLELFCLLFADDIVLLAKSAPDLQKMLEILDSYLESKKLVLNIEKSVILVFGNDEREKNKFYFKGKEMNEVKDYIYLGCKFTSSGKWSDQVQIASWKGQKASWALLKSPLRHLGPADIKLQKRIFETKVGPALSYGGEVWGFEKGEKIERIYLGHFRRLLGLSGKFNNLVLKGDLGLFSLRIKRLVRMIGYWEKVIGLQNNRLVNAAYLEVLQDRRKCSWASQVKSILNSCGLSGVWNEGKGIGLEVGNVAKLVKGVLEDQEIQKWQCEVAASVSLGIYRQWKEVWGYDNYFKAGLNSEEIKWYISGRGNFLALGERRKYLGRVRVKEGPYSCPMCGENGEDLLHFMALCPELQDLRKDLFFVNVGTSEWLVSVMGSKNYGTIRMIAKYIKLGMSHRDRFL